jgi:hypothetical protein
MKQIVHLFVFDTLADWETGYAIAGINNPDAQTNPGRYQIKTVGLTTEPVTTIDDNWWSQNSSRSYTG